MNATKFVCQVYSKTFAEKKNLDQFRCFLELSAATLYDYNFGYICHGLLLLIIAISIFGGIKGNYRWFILNQAVWDFLVSHTYCCANYTSDYVKPQMGCFYTVPKSINNYFDWLTLQLYTINAIVNNPYSALLLLTMSRMFALYYMRLYEKLTKKYRIAYTILIYNFVIMLLDSRDIFYMLKEWRKEFFDEKCETQNLTKEVDACYDLKEYEQDFWYSFYDNCEKAFTLVMYVKPLLCLFLSSIAATMIAWKVIKQAKFQLKHNPSDFKSSLRITAVIISQTVINILIFIIEFFHKIPLLLAMYFNVWVYTSQSYDPKSDYTNYKDFRLPLWFDGPSGLTDIAPRQMIKQIRVFVESLIVLFVMTGYREALVSFIKFAYSFIFHPRKAYQKITSRLKQTTTKVISLTN